jgi:hypothetical protein
MWVIFLAIVTPGVMIRSHKIGDVFLGAAVGFAFAQFLWRSRIFIEAIRKHMVEIGEDVFVGNDDEVRVQVDKLEAETPKAVLVKDSNGANVWLPLSQVSVHKHMNGKIDLFVPQWLMDKNPGLIGIE